MRVKKCMNGIILWEELGHCLKRFGNERSVFLSGKMNVKVESVEIGDMGGKWDVKSVSKNGQYLVGLLG